MAVENMNKNGWLGKLVGRGIQWLVEMGVKMLISSFINKDNKNKIEISIKTKIKPANL